MKRKNNKSNSNSSSNNNNHKKSKSNNVNNDNKEKQYNKRNPLLLAGSKGFLFTCDTMRQREAVREAYNLLDEYIEILYPSLLKKNDDGVYNNNNNTKQKPKSISEMLKEEISSVKSSMKNKKNASASQKFIKKVDSGATGLILMVCTNTNDSIQPVTIAEKICRDMLQTKQQKSRFLIRIQPYEIAGSTDEEELIQSLNTLLLRKPILLHAKTNDKNGNITSSKNMKNKVDTLIDVNNNKTSFKIVYKRRNHDKSLRNTMKQLADEIDGNKHIVNLDKPKVAIMLNIVKGTSFLSILPSFTELREYNFRKIISGK